jgi:glycosyltransferase involved in cell wall biosynthesis
MKLADNLCIVYLITKLELGGAQKVCLNLFSGMKATGNTALLISGLDGDLVGNLQQNTDVILLPTFKREVRLSFIVKELRTFIRLYQVLRQLKRNHPTIIIHTHSTKAGLIGRWAAFFAGINIRVHTVHGYAFHKHQKRAVWLIIYLLELITSFITTHYVCVSSHDVKIGIRLFPGFVHKNSIIRAAIQWDAFYTPVHLITQKAQQQKLFVFGSVACFKPQKNIHDMLKALAWVVQHYPHVKFELIGDGVLRPLIEQWIDHYNLRSYVILHGWQHKVADIMRQWHAFILSSLWEGLPCSIAEARLLGLPVLCYDSGGIKDIITHGENGLLYTPGDWQALAAGMLGLIQQPELYKKLQNHADRLDDFNDKIMIIKHLNLYRTLTKQNKGY